jgi:hypothetical protein
MKKIIQSLLLFAILLSFYFVNKKYFSNLSNTEKNNFSKSVDKSVENADETFRSNIIENLKYEINLSQNQKYLIKALLSEVYYENDIELIKMKKVEAIIFDKSTLPIKIKSDQGFYNSSNYNTEFRKNVHIYYAGRQITAEKLNIDFNNGMIKISENITLYTPETKLKADNLEINLTSKKVSVYMNDKDENVIFFSK